MLFPEKYYFLYVDMMGYFCGILKIMIMLAQGWIVLDWQNKRHKSTDDPRFSANR